MEQNGTLFSVSIQNGFAQKSVTLSALSFDKLRTNGVFKLSVRGVEDPDPSGSLSNHGLAGIQTAEEM